MTHTPGPWSLNRQRFENSDEKCEAPLLTGTSNADDDRFLNVAIGDEESFSHGPCGPQIICRMWGSGYDWANGTVEANARLIATSPELLAFADKVANFTPPGRDPQDDAETLESLIGLAQRLCAKAGQPVREWDPAEDEENEWEDA